MRFVIFLAAALALAGCTSAREDPGPTNTRTVTSTATMTRPPAKGRAVTLTYVPSRPPGTRVKGERDGRCPYLRAGLNIDATSQPNLADIEGNRVGRVTILTAHKPVGCRFYFQNDFHPIADIVPFTYPTAKQARSAMIATAETGSEVSGVPDFVKGVDGISFRTKLYTDDRGRNWAFAFAKGRVLVVVRTDRTDMSVNAVYVARAIVGRF